MVISNCMYISSMDTQTIAKVVTILKKYLLPKKEFDKISPEQIAIEIIQEVVTKD